MIYSTLYSITECFEGLVGNWTLHRQSNKDDTMVGMAVFHRQLEDVYHYQEKGILSKEGGKVYQASRDFGYSCNDDKIHIHEWDIKEQRLGKVLHRLSFLNTFKNQPYPLYSKDTYHCMDDVYKLTYSFISPKKIYYHYSIKGPYKDYSIETILIKKTFVALHKLSK